MQIEYEATFENINKEEIREKLQSSGAKMIKPEFMQKRVVFNLPKGHELQGGWARVRDEGDKITLSIKAVNGSNIENQHEVMIVVNDFEKTAEMLEVLGCERKAFQESKRELWLLDGADITIDEWPFLEPFVEVEAGTEFKVKEVSEKIGFDYNHALFGSVDTQYAKKYNLTEKVINNNTPEILFGMENPFINRKDEIY